MGQRGAEVAALKHAIPYVRMFKGKTFVVKLGGETLADELRFRGLIEQVDALHQVGIRVVLVHGGGPQSTALATALGIPTRMIDGRRVTDEKNLEVSIMTLNGQLNTRILGMCRAFGLPAVGLSGVDAGLVRAKKRAAGGDGREASRSISAGSATSRRSSRRSSPACSRRVSCRCSLARGGRKRPDPQHQRRYRGGRAGGGAAGGEADPGDRRAGHPREARGSAQPGFLHRPRRPGRAARERQPARAA